MPSALPLEVSLLPQYLFLLSRTNPRSYSLKQLTKNFLQRICVCRSPSLPHMLRHNEFDMMVRAWTEESHRPNFKSWLYHLIAVWTWVCYLISVNLTFVVMKCDDNCSYLLRFLCEMFNIIPGAQKALSKHWLLLWLLEAWIAMKSEWHFSLALKAK